MRHGRQSSRPSVRLRRGIGHNTATTVYTGAFPLLTARKLSVGSALEQIASQAASAPHLLGTSETRRYSKWRHRKNQRTGLLSQQSR